jgi:hypothetical protein
MLKLLQFKAADINIMVVPPSCTYKLQTIVQLSNNVLKMNMILSTFLLKKSVFHLKTFFCDEC